MLPRFGGVIFGNLVDIDDAGQTVAKMRVVIWRADYEKIQKKLADAGCRQPSVMHDPRFKKIGKTA